MVTYLYVLMAIIGIAFFVVLMMILDVVFNEIETGANAKLVYKTPKKAPARETF
jgi:hypothetical protein